MLMDTRLSSKSHVLLDSLMLPCVIDLPWLDLVVGREGEIADSVRSEFRDPKKPTKKSKKQKIYLILSLIFSVKIHGFVGD